MSERDRLLVADIGGTNARFALVAAGEGAPRFLHQGATPVSAHAGPEAAIAAFLAGWSGAPPGRAVLAVAAQPFGTEYRFTNSAWRFTPQNLAATLRLDALKVVNDFQAMARGALAAPAGDFAEIRAGVAAPGAPVSVLGPGTGLGLAHVMRVNGAVRVIASEGGHAAFAAQDEREAALLAHLRASHGYVSWERIVSGPGLAEIYRALSGETGRAPEAITAAARDKSDIVAVETVDLFLAALGTFAGDAALIAGARGGVILCGGLLATIAPLVAASRFAERFCERGKMSEYARRIPVRLLVNPLAPLIGAALLAGEEIS